MTEGQILDIDLLPEADKKLSFDSLLVIDDEKILVGSPVIKDAKVTAEVVEADFKGEKVVAIRYKPKKRVRKTRGHRQRFTKIKIAKISTSK